MSTSVKDCSERVKRPLVRLAQPVKVVKKAPIPVDKLRKTKVCFVAKVTLDRYLLSLLGAADASTGRPANQKCLIRSSRFSGKISK